MQKFAKVSAGHVREFLGHEKIEDLICSNWAFQVLCVELLQTVDTHHGGFLRSLLHENVKQKLDEVVNTLEKDHGLRVNPEDLTKIEAISAEPFPWKTPPEQNYVL